MPNDEPKPRNPLDTGDHDSPRARINNALTVITTAAICYADPDLRDAAILIRDAVEELAAAE